MTQERIYKLAYKALYDKWNQALAFKVSHKESKGAEYRERRAWDDLMEMENLILESGFSIN